MDKIYREKNGEMVGKQRDGHTEAEREVER
jgi:hypothetical protein